MTEFYKIGEFQYYAPYKRLLIKTKYNIEKNEDILKKSLSEFSDKVPFLKWPNQIRRHFIPRNAYLLVSDVCNCK